MTTIKLKAENDAMFNADIAKANAATSGQFDITVTTQLDGFGAAAIDLHGRTSMVINGNGNNFDGGGPGLSVYAGAVKIEDLTIENIDADDTGRPAPGTKGFAGALYVGAHANVALDDVGFSNDAVNSDYDEAADIFAQLGAKLSVTGGSLENGYTYEEVGHPLTSPGVFLQGDQSITFGTGQASNERTVVPLTIDDPSGTGSIIIAGDGTVVLSGDNELTGGLTISQGGTVKFENVESCGAAHREIVFGALGGELAIGFQDGFTDRIDDWGKDCAIDFETVRGSHRDTINVSGQIVTVDSAFGKEVDSFTTVQAMSAADFQVGLDNEGNLVVEYPGFVHKP